MAKKELVTVVKGEISDFEKKMAQVKGQMQDLGKKMTNIGKTMSLAVTAPLTALGVAATKAFSVQEAAERKLAAAIQATGGDVDKNLVRFKRFASDLQAITTTGDEVTLGMIQMAQTMGLSADQSERAAQNAIAMEAAFGVSAASAMRYTAALEQGDATMLKRYIPALRDVTDESQLAAKAQEILGNAFMVAQEDAKTFAGQTAQLKNAWGDLLEQFGKVIAGAITPLIAKLRSIVSWMQGLDESTKKIVVAVAGFAAAIGPLMIVLGTFTSKVLPALISGGKLLATAWLPVTAIVLGIYGAYRLFNTEAEKTNKIIESFKDKTDIQLEIEKDALSKQLDQQLKEAGFGSKLGLVFGQTGDVFGQFVNNIRKRLGAESELEKTMRQLKAINETINQRKKAAEEVKKVEEEINKVLADQNKVMHPKDTVDNTADMGEALEKIEAKALEVSGVIAEKLPEGLGRAVEKMKTILIDLSGLIQGMVMDSFQFLGESIGEAMSGKGFNGEKLLEMVATWAQQLGAILVSAGLAMFSFQAQFAVNPLAVVAAGGVLIAAASAVKALVANRPGGEGGGGGSYGGGSSSMGTVEGFRNLQGFEVTVTGELVGKGSDLVSVFNNEINRTNL